MGGAIIGGLLTLYGVWWTIEDNKSMRKKELELQYDPVLSYEIVQKDKDIHQLCSTIRISYNHSFFDDHEHLMLNRVIKITNVGRGEIISSGLVLEMCEIDTQKSLNLSKQFDISKSGILCDGIFEFIPVGGSTYLSIGLPKIKNMLAKGVKSNDRIRLELKIRICIQGIFSQEAIYYLHFWVDACIDSCDGSCKIEEVTFIRERQ